MGVEKHQIKRDMKEIPVFWLYSQQLFATSVGFIHKNFTE